MPTPVTAIFDIGKTNKKLLLFDSSLQVFEAHAQSFPESIDDEGFPCEDVEALEPWMQDSLAAIRAREDLSLRAINVTTYGASLAYVDREGERLAPVYNYLKPLPPPIKARFFEAYGPPEQLALATASPMLEMINAGLQLYWFRESHPRLAKNVWQALHFPQYLAYRLHGEAVSEFTSLGCHTAMWDFEANDYHQWVKKTGLEAWLPPIVPSSQTFPHPQQPDMQVGVGLHDSSASLVPYLRFMADPFMLISTGTWSIALNPFNTQPLTAGLLSQDCLDFMSYQGKPVRASRLFLGHELDHHATRLAAHFDQAPEAHYDLRPKKTLLRQLSRRQMPQLKDTLERQGHLLPEYDWSRFESFEAGYHRLMLDLVALQLQSLALIEDPTEPIQQLIVTGGMSRSQLFAPLLATQLPGWQVMTGSVSEATALGGALVMHPEARPSLDLLVVAPLGDKPYFSLD